MSIAPRRIARTIAAAALAVLSTPALALDPQRAITQYWLDTWGVKDGLPGHSIRDIEQTGDGYLWLAMQAGLVRFDGVTFKVFDETSFGGVPQNIIWSLSASRDGGLWIGVLGSGLYRYHGGVLRPYPLSGLPAPTRPNSNVLVHEAPDGQLWASSDSWGVVRIRDGAVAFHAAMPRIEVLLGDPDGALWAGTWGDGLARIQDGVLTRFHTAQGLPSAYIRALFRARDGTLWIGTRDGLAGFRDGRFAVYTTKDGLPHNEVKAIQEDRDGNLWIGTADGGLCLRRGGVFSIRRRAHGLSDDKISALHEDDEGGLWIGTHGNLDRLRNTTIAMYTVTEGLSIDSVVAATPSRDGGLWISTYGGGVSRLKDGRLTTYDARHGLPNLYVGALHEARDGTLWMGAGSNELCRLRNGRITTVDTGKRYVKSIMEDEEGLLVGLSRVGLHRLESDRLVPYRTPAGEEIPQRFVNVMYRGRDGTFWVGGSEGLSGVRQGRLITQEGLPPGGVDAFYEDADGTIWLGTAAGLARLKDGVVHLYRGRPEFELPGIATLLEDRTGHLWFTTNKGIVRVAKADLDARADGGAEPVRPRVFANHDGIKIVEFRGPVVPRGCASPDGRLWFPSVGGLAMIDPDALVLDRKVPPVHIERVVMDGKELLPADGLVVPAGTEKVEIHYTALTFTVPRLASFRYRLVGFGRDWVDAGAQRVAHFTKLPPGSFRFQVLAANSEGVWNETGGSLRLSQAPRFHQTLWFQALVVLAIALAGLATHLFGVRRLIADIEHRKEVERALRGAQGQLTQSLREKEVLLREIHHRVKNNFQIVISLLSLQSASMKGSPAQEALQESQDRIRSMALVHERLYNAGDLGRIDAQGYIRSLASSLFSSYGVLADRVRLRLDVEDVTLGIEAAVPCGLIVNELVSNALKHAFPGQRQGEVTIALRREAAGGLLLCVADDGVGFPPGLDYRKTESLGLQLVNTLVTQLDGTLTRREPPGTRFEIRFAEPLYKQRM